MTAWEQLVEKFADGRSLCNCRQAYYSPIGKGISCIDGHLIELHNMPVCKDGCSANMLRVKEEIAERCLSVEKGL